MNTEFLKLEGISKRFGAVQALRALTLAVGPRERLVVLGPTGAGKTTLLRTIAGLETPDTGRVRMEGEDITFWLPAERDVALVFQNFSLYPRKTVRQNLTFPLKAPGRDLSRDEIEERVTWVASILNITRLLDRPATHLSGGEMQRVAIGRAIVRRPRLFLMDEPLTNLDAKLRETLRVELIQLQERLQTPMSYVTHDPVEALSIAHRIAVLSEGRILQVGPPEEIYRHPVSPAVARQLGYPPINLVPVRRAKGHWVSLAGVPLAPAEPEAPSGGMLGVRPENIHPTGGQVPATVRMIENMGPAQILLVQWAGQDLHLTVPAGATFSPGEKISPKIDTTQINLWPLESAPLPPDQTS